MQEKWTDDKIKNIVFGLCTAEGDRILKRKVRLIISTLLLLVMVGTCCPTFVFGDDEAAVQADSESVKAEETAAEQTSGESEEAVQNSRQLEEAAQNSEQSEAAADSNPRSAEENGEQKDGGVHVQREAQRASQPAAADAASHFHAQIVSGQDSYSSEATAVYSVKYTLDQNVIREGDYIYVTVPESVASSVDLAVSSQHFKSTEKIGTQGGKITYRLTFGPNANSALSGSFSMFIHTKKVDTQTAGQVTAGDAAASICVNPAGGSTGTGEETRAISKDANGDTDGTLSYSGWDTSDGRDHASIIQVMTKVPTYVGYRIFVNPKKGTLSDVVVSDPFPEGMKLDSERPVIVKNWETGDLLDPSEYSIGFTKNALTFRHPGELKGVELCISYSLKFQDGQDPSKGKYENKASVHYTENGSQYSEYRGAVVQGASFSASNGEKSVDKNEITSDPSDQTVTYTIKFWNNNGFKAGEINLTDQLDSYVRYIGAVSNDCFSIRQDESDPQKIHITNTKDISGDQTMYVRFMTDFTNVPIGYTVSNTVGGNTTKTEKVSSPVRITAKKEWDDRNNADGIRPESVTLQLMNGTETVGDPVTVSAKSGWTHTWEALPECDEDGTKIAYSVMETGTVPGYTSSGVGTKENSYTITNTEKTKTETVPGFVTIKKTDGEKELGGAEFGVYGDEECAGSPLFTFSAGTKTLSTEEFAAYLPNAGNTVSYYLKEIHAPDGYDTADSVHTIRLESKITHRFDPDGTYVTGNAYDMTVDGRSSLTVVNSKSVPEISPKPAQVQLAALKTVDGEKPGDGEIFSFELAKGADVLQTKKNDAEGKIVFDALSYGKEDMGKTYVYTIREKTGEADHYIYDTTRYQVTVRIAGTLQPDGTVRADVTYAAVNQMKDSDAAAENVKEAVFNNKVRKDPIAPDGDDHPEKLEAPEGIKQTPDGNATVTDGQKTQTVSTQVKKEAPVRKTGSAGAVKTGDNAPAEAVIMMLLLAGSLAALLNLKKRNQ